MTRPLLRESELRNRVEVYFNATEHADIARRALQSHLAVSSFIRKAALGHRIATVPTGNAERWASLAKLAANCNQIAHHLNSGHAQGYDSQLIETLLAEVRALRLDLIGAAE